MIFSWLFFYFLSATKEVTEHFLKFAPFFFWYEFCKSIKELHGGDKAERHWLLVRTDRLNILLLQPAIPGLIVLAAKVCSFCRLSTILVRTLLYTKRGIPLFALSNCFI
jgi:hypothetical protein